jgi:hypothetical protein
MFCIFEPGALDVFAKVIELYGKYLEAVSGSAHVDSAGVGRLQCSAQPVKSHTCTHLRAGHLCHVAVGRHCHAHPSNRKCAHVSPHARQGPTAAEFPVLTARQVFHPVPTALGSIWTMPTTPSPPS